MRSYQIILFPQSKLSQPKPSKVVKSNNYFFDERRFSSNQAENINKVAIINGAYGGIGSIIARKMLGSGYHVGLMGKDENKLFQLEETIKLEFNQNKVKAYKQAIFVNGAAITVDGENSYFL